MKTIDKLIELHEENEKDNLIIFVGAGISEHYSELNYYSSSSAKSKIKKGKKFPSWSDLVSKIVPPDMDSNEVKDFLRQVQIYEDNYSKEKVTFKVKKAFPEEYDFFDIHKLIIDVNPIHIITTNYDQLLEKAIIDSWTEKYHIVDCDASIPFSDNKKNFLVKAHGDLLKGNIVFSEKDYNDYHINFPLILSFLRYAFSKFKVLFIGFSLNDPNFNKILYWVKNILNENAVRHAVIFDSEISHSEFNYFSKRSIDAKLKGSDPFKK